MRVLHINAPPRGSNSQSLAIAEHLIGEIGRSTEIIVDNYNLFEDGVPPFDGVAVGAKMALFTGAEADSEQKRAWETAKAVFERFAAADLYVFNVPLWNNGLPYILKQFIDVVTQPGWTFGFDMEKGYSGLLSGKKACVVHASGVYYEGIAPNFGADFSTPYLDDWLKFIGVETVEHIHVAPTVVNPDLTQTKAAAQIVASAIARKLSA